MSDTSQLTTCWSHRREPHCGTDSRPTAPQGSGLRDWPQSVTRTMLSIMPHGSEINKTQEPPVSYQSVMQRTSQRCSKTVPKQRKTQLWETEHTVRNAAEKQAAKWPNPLLRAPDNKYHEYTMLFTVCHPSSAQSAPGEGPVIVLSAAGLQRGPLT